jgi:iron(III) transport system substrate-binding protein
LPRAARAYYPAALKTTPARARRAVLPCLAALLAALALAACGSPSSTSSSGRKTSKQVQAAEQAVAGLPIAQREGKLRALASKEGRRLTLYTTLNPKVLKPFLAGFQRKYGIQVDAFTTEPASLLQRVSQETQAGKRAADVVDTGGPELNQMAKGGAFADFRTPLQSRLGPGAVQHGWTTSRYTQFIVAWNTKRVKPGQQPRSWEELADPKWKGRLSLSPDTTGVSLYKGLSDYWRQTKGRTQAQSDRIFEGIARNSRIVPQFAVNAQLLATGEIDAAAGSVSTNGIEELRTAHVPVAWQPAVQPIVRQRQGVALVRDAPHPASALLFLDYELGDGQLVLAADHRDPARVDLSSTGSAKTTLVNLDSLAAQQAELSRRWDRIVGLGARRGGG